MTTFPEPRQLAQNTPKIYIVQRPHSILLLGKKVVVFFQSCHKMLASLTVATAAQCMHSDRGVHHFQDFEVQSRCVAFFLYGKSESQTSLALLAKQIWRH